MRQALDVYQIILNRPQKGGLVQGVRCVFDKQYGPALSRLAAGQTVTVQGKFAGSIIDISLRDCVLAG